MCKQQGLLSLSMSLMKLSELNCVSSTIIQTEGKIELNIHFLALKLWAHWDPETCEGDV